MNILIIGPIPPKYEASSYGGIATHIEGLAKALTNKNHSVNLWYHKPQKKVSLKNIEVIPNNYIDYLFSFFLVFSFLFKKELAYLNLKQRILLGFQTYRLKKILNQEGFDCIHIHSLHNTSAIGLQYINKKVLPPVVITDHGFWQDPTTLLFNSKSHRKIKAVVAYCDQLIYISDYAKQQHLKIDFGQYDKLIKIKNPIVVVDKVNRQKKSSNNHTIFFNGLTKSLKIKRLDLLLKTVQEDEYLRNHVNVIVIANSEAHRYIANEGFDFNIELHTATTWENVKEFYMRSDLFVLPSKSESFGLVYLEALSFGLPIIGFEDVFEEFQSNISAYIGEPFNSERETSVELAEKMKRALNNPFNYNNIYDVLKKTYNWENNIDNYESIYKKVER